MSGPVREAPASGSGREQALREELRRAYEHLSEITSRLLLANEAADAALSSHDRTELSEQFLAVAARGTGARRAALFLAEPDGFSVGATLGLDESERESIAASAADIDACSRALESGRAEVFEPDLIAPDAIEEDEEAGEGSAEDAAEAADGSGDADDGGPEASAETAGDPPCFGLYLPVRTGDSPTAVLALGERARGRPYEREDVVFLEHLLRQFAVALHRAVLIAQNEERLRELDALLRVSRQITSTLDLDSVLRSVVNTVAAVVENDRAEIAMVRGGALVLRAVSGMTRLDPDQAELLRLRGPLEYLRLRPARLHIGADDLGTDPTPAGAEVFERYFGEQEMRSFMALPLRDDQGLLGFLCIESRQESWSLQPAEGDALEVLAAQTTVAIRNATLYSEVPLRGVARPITKLRSRLRAAGPRTRALVAAGAAVAALALLLPVFPERAGGPAEVRPLHLRQVRVLTDGVVSRVLVPGGDRVAAGQPLAVIEDLELSGRLARLAGEIDVLRREVAGAQRGGDVAAWRSGQIRLAALERNRSYEEERARGRVLTAPFSGTVLELDLARQLGQHKSAGESFCTVAALESMVVEIDVQEEKIGRVRPGQPVALKVQAFPTRTFHGTVTEVGWRGHAEAGRSARFLVRASVPNAGGLLRPGMSGVAKAGVGRRPLAALAIDPFLRAFQMGMW